MFAEKKLSPNTGQLEWTFITQRQYPHMACITTSIVVDRKSPTGGTLSVTFPLKPRRFPFLNGSSNGTRTFDLPLAANKTIMSKYPLDNVKIWKCYPMAYNMSSAVSPRLAELSAFLGAKGDIALFRVYNEKLREVYRNAPTREELGFQSVVGFADAVSNSRDCSILS